MFEQDLDPGKTIYSYFIPVQSTGKLSCQAILILITGRKILLIPREEWKREVVWIDQVTGTGEMYLYKKGISLWGHLILKGISENISSNVTLCLPNNMPKLPASLMVASISGVFNEF